MADSAALALTSLTHLRYSLFVPPPPLSLTYISLFCLSLLTKRINQIYAINVFQPYTGKQWASLGVAQKGERGMQMRLLLKFRELLFLVTKMYLHRSLIMTRETFYYRMLKSSDMPVKIFLAWKVKCGELPTLHFSCRGIIFQRRDCYKY
ncbi:hypothetical protein L7F22_056636 [Adiantum nelumboides]|nr:hypothetical protein [Adiantum nelumboides]